MDEVKPHDLAVVRVTVERWLDLLQDAVPALEVLANLERETKHARERGAAAEAKSVRTIHPTLCISGSPFERAASAGAQKWPRLEPAVAAALDSSSIKPTTSYLHPFQWGVKNSLRQGLRCVAARQLKSLDFGKLMGVKWASEIWRWFSGGDDG